MGFDIGVDYRNLLSKHKFNESELAVIFFNLCFPYFLTVMDESWHRRPSHNAILHFEFCEHWCLKTILCLKEKVKFCPHFLHFWSNFDKIVIQGISTSLSFVKAEWKPCFNRVISELQLVISKNIVQYGWNSVQEGESGEKPMWGSMYFSMGMYHETIMTFWK